MPKYNVQYEIHTTTDFVPVLRRTVIDAEDRSQIAETIQKSEQGRVVLRGVRPAEGFGEEHSRKRSISEWAAIILVGLLGLRFVFSQIF